VIEEHPEYQFGEFLVEPSQNQISISGDVRPLEPRTMDVLVYLIEHSKRIVSAEELLEKLWPGRVVEESTIHRRINQLRKTLEDSARQSRYIKTVVKRGYQAVAEVSIPSSIKTPPTSSSPTGPSKRIILSTIAMSLLLLTGLGYFLRQDDPEILPAFSDSNLTIAVLPFTNMSNSSENAFFAAGIHEDLLTKLSGIVDLTVISRTSVMRYAGHAQSVKQIGAELGVNYVVEGSVRRQNQQVRISVQLIDARQDKHLWAMTYDRDLSDTFALQSEITREVAEQLSLELVDGEVVFYDTEIDDLLFKARELMRERTSESLSMALESLRSARISYPENAKVHAAIGEALYLQSRANESWQDVAEETLHSLELALELDPDLVDARLALAQVQIWWLRDLPAADANYQAVIQAAPNNADALMKYGAFLANARAMRDIGMPHLRRAVVLNPYSGEAWALLASNLMRQGNFAESYEVLMSGFDRVPDDYYLLRYRMEYFLYSGDRVEALKHMLELVRRDPDSLGDIALLADNLRRLEFYAEAQLWLDEMFRINPEHSNTYDSEVKQLRYQKDWQGLAQINARWEPILGDYVKAPIRNWNLWSMQAEADSLWQQDKTDQALRIYGEIVAFLMPTRIPDLMGQTALGAGRLELGIMLAHALIRTGHVDEAEDLLIKITRNKGTGGGFAISKIEALAMLGKTDQAIKDFGEMLTPIDSGTQNGVWYVPGVSERGISKFMDVNTDWLNGVNRDSGTVKVYEEYLTIQAAERNRVRAEIPALFDPAAFLHAASP